MPRQKKNSSKTSFSARLFQFKKQLHQYRTKMNTVLSLWNIVFTLGTLWLVQWVETGSVTWNVFTLPESDETSVFTFEISVLVAQVCYRCMLESGNWWDQVVCVLRIKLTVSAWLKVLRRTNVTSVCDLCNLKLRFQIGHGIVLEVFFSKLYN